MCFLKYSMCWHDNLNKIFLFILRFDVDVPGGSSYKESSFTEAGKLLTYEQDLKVKSIFDFLLHSWLYLIDLTRNHFYDM